MLKFKKNNTLGDRKRESDRLCIKYKNKIPVVVGVNGHSVAGLILDKHKYISPRDITVGQFIFILRKRMVVTDEQALFILFNNKLPPTSSLMGTVYDEYKDVDGFLYAVISLESTFG